ncbi:unnamed protein product [Phytophthora lilii]|uniref:Unnamed protein product n=1 Tax=Phytophthora lilii TaxID=2077276 RepID=A0A9W6WXT7_9STRA|nr:unnamed protein product [Phytophthora lilii]
MEERNAPEASSPAPSSAYDQEDQQKELLEKIGSRRRRASHDELDPIQQLQTIATLKERSKNQQTEIERLRQDCR